MDTLSVYSYGLFSLTCREQFHTTLVSLLKIIYAQRPKLCGATRTSDGTHVVLQLIAIGNDGQRELEILKRLYLSPIDTTYKNRCVPLLGFIEYQNMVFGIFPLLLPCLSTVLCRTVREAFKLMDHCLEVSWACKSFTRYMNLLCLLLI